MLKTSQSVSADPTSDPKSHRTEVGPKYLNIGLSDLIVKVFVIQQKLTDTSGFFFSKSWPYSACLGPQRIRNQCRDWGEAQWFTEQAWRPEFDPHTVNKTKQPL